MQGGRDEVERQRGNEGEKGVCKIILMNILSYNIRGEAVLLREEEFVLQLDQTRRR